MEAYLTELIGRVRRTAQTLPEIFARVVERDSEVIIDMNVDQLRRGKTKNNELITPEYRSDVYGEFKKSIGSEAPLGTPDLILEGDFTEAFYIERKGDQILHDSKDSKTAELDAKYDNIFGLTTENKQELINRNAQEIIKEIENEIFTR